MTDGTAGAERQKQSHTKRETVKVTVSFPLAGKRPYKADDDLDTTAASVRTAAMSHFGVADDENTVYYLTHKGDRVEPDETVGDLADEAHAVKFTLVKELIQG